MALPPSNSLHLLLLIPLLLLTLTPSKVIASSHHHHHHRHNLKSLHFTLFQHETINKTGYIIVEGIPGGAGVTQTTTPFGTYFVFQDTLTETSNMSPSKVVGTAEGTSITSSFDGLQSISIATLNLNLKNHKGSVSVLGVVNNVKHSNLPVVGGTEDFLFAQGYLTSSPVDLKGQTVVYKLEFHLYWPPYAS